MSTETGELNKLSAPVKPLPGNEDSRTKAEAPARVLDLHNDGSADANGSIKQCKEGGCSSSAGKVCAPCEGTAYNPKRAWFQESSTKLVPKSVHQGDIVHKSCTKGGDSFDDANAKGDVDEPQDEDNTNEEDYDEDEEYHGEQEGELDEDDDEDEDDNDDDDDDGDDEEVNEPPTKRKK